jgi:hypothetical protein
MLPTLEITIIHTFAISSWQGTLLDTSHMKFRAETQGVQRLMLRHGLLSNDDLLLAGQLTSW